jgi:hypothetical protein
VGSSGKSTTSYLQAAAPGTIAPVAPIRTAAGEQPENVDKALFTSGAKKTDAENIAAGKGSSRLVIPLEGTTTSPDDNAQSGGYTAAPTAQGVV